MHFQPAVFQRTIQKDPTLLVPLPHTLFLAFHFPLSSFLLSWLHKRDWILFLKSRILKRMCARVINSAVGQMHHKNQPHPISLYEAAARGNKPRMYQHKCTFISKDTHAPVCTGSMRNIQRGVVCVPRRSQSTLQTGGGDDSSSVVKYTWPAWCPAAVWWVANHSTDTPLPLALSLFLFLLSYTASWTCMAPSPPLQSTERCTHPSRSNEFFQYLTIVRGGFKDIFRPLIWK